MKSQRIASQGWQRKQNSGRAKGGKLDRHSKQLFVYFSLKGRPGQDRGKSEKLHMRALELAFFKVPTHTSLFYLTASFALTLFSHAVSLYGS